jgi:hypothetical protein
VGYQLLADLIVALHLLFIVFALLGGLAVIRWWKLAAVHLPSAFWAFLVELFGWTCPLTPLENHLRRMGGGVGYSTDFVDRYLMPILYPENLTRAVQISLGLTVLAVNIGLYWWALRRRRGKVG